MNILNRNENEKYYRDEKAKRTYLAVCEAKKIIKVELKNKTMKEILEKCGIDIGDIPSIEELMKKENNKNEKV